MIFFFFAQFNNNSKKKKISNPWVQPDPCGLGWTYAMGWVGLNFFLYLINPIHAHPYFLLILIYVDPSLLVKHSQPDILIYCEIKCKMECIGIGKINNAHFASFIPHCNFHDIKFPSKRKVPSKKGHPNCQIFDLLGQKRGHANC